MRPRQVLAVLNLITIMKKYYTISELASYIKEKGYYHSGKAPHIETIRKWVREEKIPTLRNDGKQGRVILFDKIEIENWLENGGLIQI